MTRWSEEKERVVEAARAWSLGDSAELDRKREIDLHAAVRILEASEGPMANLTMVNELALRLLLIYERVPTPDPMSGPMVFVSEAAEESFRLMAREVIRQMEFARRERPCECGHCGRGEGDPLLTLAPPDWTPE
jgi:hypothetical protein